MCLYSHLGKTRAAHVDDKLTISQFSHARGFARPQDVAVPLQDGGPCVTCLEDGTTLLMTSPKTKKAVHTTFVHGQTAASLVDAIRFPDDKVLTPIDTLDVGTHATVVALPKTASVSKTDDSSAINRVLETA